MHNNVVDVLGTFNSSADDLFGYVSGYYSTEASKAFMIAQLSLSILADSPAKQAFVSAYVILDDSLGVNTTVISESLKVAGLGP